MAWDSGIGAAAQFEALWNAPIGLALLDRDLRCVRVNPALAAMTGMSAERSLGKTVAELLPHQHPELLGHLRGVCDSGSPIDVEVSGSTRDAPDVRRRWRISGMPVVQDGRIVGVSVTVVDGAADARATAALGEPETRFCALADNIAQLAWMADETGWVYWYNRRWFEYTGTTLASVQGWGWRQVHHPDHVDRVVARISCCFRLGEPWEDTFPMRARDGSYRWFLSRAVPIRDDAGKVVVWFGTNTDITEQLEADAALRASEVRYRALFENLPDAVILSVPDGHLVAANQAACAMFGMSEPEILSRGREGLVDAADGRIAAAIEERRRTGRIVRREMSFIRKDGDRFPAEVTSVIVAGGQLRAFLIIRDITDRKRAEETIREVDRRKNEFLAMLSHELRNPLAPIRNSLYVLERAVPGGEQAERARRVIDRQVEHLTRLIEDLLDVTRISHGRIALKRERIDLDPLVRAAADDYRAEYARNGIRLTVEVASKPLWVDGDRTRLAQVIGNLLCNSAKFTPRGGQVYLTATADPAGGASIRVRDDGAGMAPDTMRHLFEPFVQAAQPLDRTSGGLGLGLALVKGLIEMHGGQVSAHSDGDGRGSEFTVTLPRAPEAEPRAVIPADGDRRGRGRRVLVIEDNLDAAESLREALELGDHEVALAFTGPEGVEAARRGRPDVIICDIGLPELDGYGVARALRADPDPAVQSVFLVALSGYALREDIEKSLEAGFDRHLAKPPSIEALEALLSELPPERAVARVCP